MDKFEYELKVEQIEKLIRRGDNITAKKIADGMDWKKEKDTRLLRSVAELYVQAGEDEKALYFLRQAYNASPRGIMILERMINVALGSDNLDVAEEFCDAYSKVAPDSSEYALFRYKIAVEKQAPASELIKWLKLYTNREMDEEYCYKLAELYEEINDRVACIKQCDYIIDFFCFGEYVEKAAALKERFAELDEYQVRRMNQREDYENEYNEYIKETNHRQRRQAMEEAAEKQIIEDQLMEKHEAELGEQISEIVEEQKKEQEEIHLDTLVMDEILQAEKALEQEKNQEVTEEPEAETDTNSEPETETEDEEFEEASGGGFWAGIKAKLKKQGQISEEAEEFEKVKNELEGELQDATDELWKNIEETEQTVSEEPETAEEVVEEVAEAEPEAAEEEAEAEPEVAEEEVEEEPEVEEEEIEEEPEAEEEEVEEESEAEEEEVEEEPKAVEEEVEEEPKAVEKAAEEEVSEETEESDAEEKDDIDTEAQDEFEEKPEKPAPKRHIRKREKTEEEEEEHFLEAPEASFMVACMDIDAGVKFAIEMVRRMEKDIRFETIGKMTAREVNKVKFGVIKSKFNQDAMMITGAGELSQGAADNIHKWMKGDDNNCVILVDSKQHLADLERRSPKLMHMITAQYEYQVIDKDNWLDMIEQKAKAEGVILDDGAYELFEKYLDEKISRGEVIVGQDLDDALYDAIEKAEGLSIGGIISGIMATKYDEDGMLIIKEKHFS